MDEVEAAEFAGLAKQQWFCYASGAWLNYLTPVVFGINASVPTNDTMDYAVMTQSSGKWYIVIASKVLINLKRVIGQS